MEQIIGYIRQNGGYARMLDLKRASFQTRDIARLHKEGVLHKIKPGLYRLAGSRITPDTDLIDVCHAIPGGVICLLSALSYYRLLPAPPSEIHVAIPHSSKAPKIFSPPVKVYYFRDRFYSSGIITYKIPHGSPKIYCMEKTVCDMFRYRKKLGEKPAIAGLKNYLNRKEANIPLLQYYAEKCRVGAIMAPYVRALSY
jgi:predicted transcriptional regulator of viral defense system